MSCEKWDEEIALWAGGDEVGSEFPGHLEGCRRCRGEVAAMKLAMGQWADWSPAARPRRLVWWWGAVAALVPLVVWVGWPRPVAVEELMLAMPTGPRAPVVERVIVVKQVEREKAVTVKIFTEDPDVVILLLGDAE